VWAGDRFPKVSHGKPWFYLEVYIAVSCVAALCILIRSVITAYCSVRAGRRIHDRAFTSVLACPMAFFDTTPLGRILNRFSTDVQKLDVQIAQSGSSFCGYTVSLVCTLIIIGLVSPYVLIALPPLSFMYTRYASYYRNSAREMQRLESMSRSPIYASFSEALGGAQVIQAYGATERFLQVNRSKVDYNMRAYIAGLAANRWLTVRLEFFSNCLLALTALLSVITSLAGAGGDAGAKSRAALAGLALTYAPGLTDTLNFLIRQFTQLETQMVSVERLLNYSSLPAQTTAAPIEVADDWPQTGAIAFKDVRFGYREGLPDVLTGCDLRVAAREKIGIVGRTGAGKSSIFVVLYRLAELRGGAIEIDGIDIARVALPQLRSRLGIIPQDPVLFTGTLRLNVDPLGQYSDAVLWGALAQCGIDAAMAEHPQGLDRPIEERGSNLSMGQRQLLCLCRALLKRSRILVLDEATASVDMESDALIQQTLRNELSRTTVMTIAHRLDTIMHCDRIVVMHAGVVAEAGPPLELRERAGSRFAELWEKQEGQGQQE